MIFPLSTSLAAVLNVGLLLALLPKKSVSVATAPLARFTAALVAASLAGGAAAWLVNGSVAGRFGTSFAATAGSVVVSGLAGLAVFYAASRLLGLAEVRDFLRRLSGRGQISTH
jgi:peptidoglycan biosynthesis protein MviN/MurJ (putative lipid II flippase)